MSNPEHARRLPSVGERVFIFGAGLTRIVQGLAWQIEPAGSMMAYAVVRVRFPGDSTMCVHGPSPGNPNSRAGWWFSAEELAAECLSADAEWTPDGWRGVIWNQSLRVRCTPVMPSQRAALDAAKVLLQTMIDEGNTPPVPPPKRRSRREPSYAPMRA